MALSALKGMTMPPRPRRRTPHALDRHHRHRHRRAHPTAASQPRHAFRHRPPAPSKPSTPPTPTRRQLVTAILLSQPGHDWHGFELAEKLQIKQHNLLTQLAEWAA
jgi:hypothetical protein